MQYYMYYVYTLYIYAFIHLHFITHSLTHTHTHKLSRSLSLSHTHTHIHMCSINVTPPPSFSCATSGITDTSNDQLLAMMLQLEFDKQHDTILKAEEKAYNKDSKGTILHISMCIVYMYIYSLWWTEEIKFSKTTILNSRCPDRVVHFVYIH